MSVLTSKHVLLVGGENEKLTELENKLQSRGMIIHKSACENVSAPRANELKIDLVIVNHIDSEDVCGLVVNKLQPNRLERSVPTLVLVNGSDEEVQSSLAQGAADYITPHEDADSIVSKVQAVLGQENDFSSVSSIDISPTIASTTTTGVKVYIIEDDPLLRNLLSVKLEKSSFPFEFSDTGEHVIESIKQFSPDVILLDLMLPVKDGFEVLEELKNDERLKNTPVIVFSNRDGQDDRQRTKDLGADRFFVKAMTDLSLLIEVIEELAK